MPREASGRRVSAVTPALATSALVVGITMLLLSFDTGPSIGAPLGVVIAAPPLLYAAVALGALRGAPVIRRVAWIAAACATHITLGGITGLAFAASGLLTTSDALKQALWMSPVSPVIYLAGVPLVLWPFWRRRPARPAPRPAAPAPRPAAAAPRPPVARPAAPSASPPSSPGENPFLRAARQRAAAAAAASESAVVSTPAAVSTAAPGAPPEPAPASVRPPHSETPTAAARPPAVAPPPPAAAPRSTVPPTPPSPGPAAPLSAPAADVDRGVMLRIPFARVADQFPPGVLAIPPAAVGEHLLEPSTLLVALDAVLRQLPDGEVSVDWPLIADQFPPMALAGSSAEVAARLVGWRLLLPVEEIVRQVPPDVFGRATARSEMDALEAFPPPFQPFSSRDADTVPVSAAPAPEPSRMPPAASIQPAAPGAPRFDPAAAGNALAAALAAETHGAPTRVAPRATVIASAPPAAATPAPPQLAAATTPARQPEPRAPRAPVRQAGAPPVTAPGVPQSPETAPSQAAREEAANLAERLGAVGTFEAALQRQDGLTVASYATADVALDAVDALARRVAPMLQGGAQITVRAATASIVVAGATATTVAAAVRAGAPVAFLEILLVRAGDRRPEPPATDADAALAPATHARLREACDALGAFGGLTPAAFVDAARGLSLYVFCDGDPAAAATLARRVWAALLREAEPRLGAIRSVTVRRGASLTVVRPLGDGRAELLVATGPTRRAGLAQRQAAHAAAILTVP